MDTALKLIALIALCIFMVVSIWGFVLFNRLAMDIRQQNMVLYSIIEKLTNKIDENK